MLWMYWRGSGSELLRFPLLAATLALVLAGCAPWSGSEPQPRGRVVVDWHCQTDPETGVEQCHKRKLVDGEPIDDVIYDTRRPADKDQPVSSANGDAVRWDKQPLTAVNRVGDSGDLAVENKGPELRETRDTVDLWSDDERASGDDATSGEKKPKEGPRIEPRRRAALLGMPDANVSTPGERDVDMASGKRPEDESLSGYTVQLAAFPNARQRDAFIARHGLSGESLHTRKIRSRGRVWWIVARGSYPARQQAVKEYRQLAERRGIEGWVRSWDSIHKLEVD